MSGAPIFPKIYIYGEVFLTDAFDPTNHPHRRTDPLTGRHVLVSPHRALRPWLGQVDEPDEIEPISYDQDCYLCPRNERVGGIVNPDYSGAYVFENDFPALLTETPAPQLNSDPLFEMASARGTSRVICFSPNHNATLPRLSPAAMRSVIDTWCAQTQELGRDHIWVQIFENKGAMMGCSNPHPHGQVWAVNYLPDEVTREDERQRAYFAIHGRAMLLDVAEREMALGERVVVSNDHWLAVVPFWQAGRSKRFCCLGSQLLRCLLSILCNGILLATSFNRSPAPTMICSTSASLTPWVGMALPLMVAHLKAGNFMLIFIRLCCGPPPFASSWLGMK